MRVRNKYRFRLACVWLCAVPLTANAIAPSPRARELIAPVHAAFVGARLHQSREGPPKSVADRLLRLEELDQAGRNVMEQTDLTPLPPDQRDAASAQAWREIDAQDRQNHHDLVHLLPGNGWFSILGYGAAASHAAWSVVQHQTDDPAFMAAMLRRMRPYALAHDIEPGDYVFLVDRVAMMENRPQTYGTQFVCRNHRWVRYALVEPGKVDDRRRAVGYGKPEAASLATIAALPPCYFAPDKK